MAGATNGSAAPGKVLARARGEAERTFAAAEKHRRAGGRMLKDRAASLASGADDVVDDLSEDARRQAGIAIAWADDAVDEMLDVGAGAVRSLSRQIKERPLAAIAIGLALGWLMGRLPDNTRRARRRFSRRR